MLRLKATKTSLYKLTAGYNRTAGDPAGKILESVLPAGLFPGLGPKKTDTRRRLKGEGS